MGVSGSFTGSSGNTPVAGTPIDGTFSVGSLAGATPERFSGPGNYVLPSGAITLTFEIAALDETFTFSSLHDGEPDFLGLTDASGVQTVLLFPDFGSPHAITGLSLTGPEGSLFTNVDDLASVHAGIGVSVVSPFGLAVYGRGSAEVDVISETFGTSVPESPGWMSLLMGVFTWGAIVYRRRPHGRDNQ